MKINNVGINKVVNLYNDNKKTIDKKQNVQGKDSLEISSLGKSLSTYSIDESFENSKEKIEALRKQITGGTYKPNSELTARKLMDAIKGRGV